MRMGHWQSGVYVVRLATRGGVIGDATLVLRPFYLGAHRVLVVEPTNTWQAYNFWGGDSWYKNKLIWKVDLSRPYAGVGLPPHFAAYDLGFLRWVEGNHAAADFVSDDDLDRFLSGKQLRRLYDCRPRSDQWLEVAVKVIFTGPQDPPLAPVSTNEIVPLADFGLLN
jgi:hypothetical protein